MLQKLNKLNQEAGEITKDLSDVDQAYNDLKKKRAEVKAVIDDLKRNPDKAVPQTIEQILTNIDDLKGKGDSLGSKVQIMDDDVEQRIKDLKDLMARYEEAKNLQFTAEELGEDMKKHFKILDDGLSKLPSKIKTLKATLEEMNKGTGPTREADYYDEKSQIRKNIESLESCEQDLLQITKGHQQKKIDFDLIQNTIKKSSSDINKMRIEVDKLDKLADSLTNLVAQFDDTKVTVDDVQEQMHDCMIPVNVDKRAMELDNYSRDLKQIKNDFIDLVKQDDSYAGDAASENEIKR